MRSEKPLWKQKGVWICTKCGQRERPTESLAKWPSDWAETQKMELKSYLKKNGRAQDIRVMTSSCLGICPLNEQVIMVYDKSVSPEKVEHYICDPAQDPNVLRKWIDEQL